MVNTRRSGFESLNRAVVDVDLDGVVKGWQPGGAVHSTPSTMALTTRETWLPVAGYVGLYEVSDWGRVRSLDRTVTFTRGGQVIRREFPGVVRQPQIDKDGYAMVQLSRDGSKKTHKRHRLVLETFVGECPSGMETLHQNGKRADNRLSNLSWGTSRENKADCKRHGTNPAGERSAQADLTDADVIEIRSQVAARIPTCEIAKLFGISRGHVSNIAAHQYWQHVKKGPVTTGRAHLKGERHARAVLNDGKVREIRCRVDDGETHLAVGRLFKVSKSTVGRIVRRESWAHVA